MHQVFNRFQGRLIRRRRSRTCTAHLVRETVFAGGAIGVLLEGAGEVGWVLEACFITDTGDGHLAVVEQFLGKAHAFVQHVVGEAEPIGFLEHPAEAKRRHATALGQIALIDAFAKMLVDVQHDVAEGLVLLVSCGQADAVGQGWGVIDLRGLSPTIGSAAQLAQLHHGRQVALSLGDRQGQHHVFPDAGAHGPYRQFFGVLHGEHGDGDGGNGSLDLQQAPQAWGVRAIEVDADHVDLFPAGQHGVFCQRAVARVLELGDEFLGGPIMSQIEP